MSLTNSERTRMINAARGEDATILGISPALLDKLNIRQYLPDSIDRLLHEHIATYYLFKPHTTDKDGKVKDGLTTYITGDHGRRLYGIGFGVDILDKTDDYKLLVLLHELAHVVLDAEGHAKHAQHDTFFHEYLNMLILEVNDFSGKSLKNDLFGFNEA